MATCATMKGTKTNGACCQKPCAWQLLMPCWPWTDPDMDVCWVLSLYGGVGSFSKPTADRPNVWSIQISNNHQTGIDHQHRIVEINYHLNKNTTLQHLYKIVWHVTGFTPASLIGVIAARHATPPPAWKNAHRSSKAEGYVAQSPFMAH